LPVMFHCLNVMQSNAYVAHRGICGVNALPHKKFLLKWVRSLMERAKTRGRWRTRSRASPNTTPQGKRGRVSLKLPVLDPKRLLDSEMHKETVGGPQRHCVYCSYLFAVEKRKDPYAGEFPSIRRVTRYCTECDISLCRLHFNVYHGRTP